MRHLKLYMSLLCIAISSVSYAQFNSTFTRHPSAPKHNGWFKSWKTNNRFELKKPRLYERAHIGYSLMAVAAQQKTMGYDFTSPNTETEITRTARTLTGHGVTVGSYLILTRFKSDFAALAFSFDFNYNKLAWEELDSGFTYRPRLDEIKPTDFTIQMGVPVSLDLKLGSDAMPSINHKWSAAIGAGIYPVLAFTAPQKKKVIRNSINFTADYMPFVKVEGGFRAGVLMKVRLLILMGGPTYLNPENTIGGLGVAATNGYSLTGQASTNIGLIVYPFSYKWPEYGWWQ